MDTPSVSQQRVTELLVRWSQGDDAALAELLSLSANQVAAGQEVPWDPCRLLKFCAALQKSAARRMSKACYRGGPKVRNSGRPKPEAKTVCEPPPGGNFKISPAGIAFASATKRLPELSKARPRGVVRPVAKILFTPIGVK